MKTESQIKTRIAQLETNIERLEKITNAPQVIPGPFETGRSNYTMGRKLDAENNRRAIAFRQLQKAKQELARLKILLSEFQAGERHLNGQPRADSPSREAKRLGQEKLAEFMRDHIKAGDLVGVAANPRNSIVVKRVNRKSITAESGSNWTFNEILLWRNGKALLGNEPEAFELLHAWLGKKLTETE